MFIQSVALLQGSCKSAHHLGGSGQSAASGHPELMSFKWRVVVLPSRQPERSMSQQCHLRTAPSSRRAGDTLHVGLPHNVWSPFKRFKGRDHILQKHC
ncbi:hypothetical protein EYF80_044791 [Liparis tanakae]|uniref:Uncharacterized protein n=1 Tax=Liparis tanakae TaxID=230148 RepID=A0A4Z2FUV4_9TELE|nr:hypothetical protein EYF80_044791 [Liparis tanakae]